jgi:hypothetical protein
MLLDWLDRCLTRCPLHLREMGYPRELFGIRRRWRQWGWAWKSHCDNTRRLILDATARCQQRRKAVVFGSGFLHDVPLAELSGAFGRVVLVDLVHPCSTRWFVKRYGNVELLTADVTDTVESVWLAVERPGTALPVSRPQRFLDDGQVDFVASVNLLSQLPCMPEQYLRRWPVLSTDQIDSFCRQLVEAHLNYLRSLPGIVALIADIESRTMTQIGDEVARRNTLYGASFPFGGERWIWPLVPRSARPLHHAEHLVVAGVENVKDSTAADPSA